SVTFDTTILPGVTGGIIALNGGNVFVTGSSVTVDGDTQLISDHTITFIVPPPAPPPSEASPPLVFSPFVAHVDLFVPSLFNIDTTPNSSPTILSTDQNMAFTSELANTDPAAVQQTTILASLVQNSIVNDSLLAQLGLPNFGLQQLPQD